MGKQIKFEKQPIYELGKCFICSEPCKNYAHYSCSLAVALKDEDNVKKMRELDKL